MYQCIESLLDRSTDFVRAAVAQRALLGGVLVLDETMDLTPTLQPAEGEGEGESLEVTGAVSSAVVGSGVSGEEQVDYDEVRIQYYIILFVLFGASLLPFGAQ